MPRAHQDALTPPGSLLLAALAAAMAIFVLHAWLYGGWICDDAGISFTYARNLAHGDGLVLNPGGPRVEGYSDPAWVFLLALLMKAGLFDPVITPKALALLLTAGTFYLLARIGGEIFGWPSSIVHALPALLLACSVPFVSWSISGLENPLFLFLLALALRLHLAETGDPSRIPWSALPLFVLAITRPEGAMYACALLAHRLAMGAFRPSLLKRTPLWLLFFAAPFAAYHAWHHAYFAEWLPNTYFAKLRGGTDLWGRFDKEVRHFDSTGWKYVRGAFSDYRLGWVAAPCLLAALLRFRRRAAGVLLVALVAALDVFYAVYVGGDWMNQYRFLGPVFLVTCLLAAGGVLAVRLDRDPSLHDPSRGGARGEELPAKRRFSIRRRSIPMSESRRSVRLGSAALMSAAALATGLALVLPNAWILSAPLKAPSISFESVAERGRSLAALASDLGIRNASLMDPDLGGTSWASGLTMIDLGGLADAHIARYGYDPRFFLPYVFDERKPTFIHTHCVWSRDTRVNESPRFRKDYLAIREEPCALECCRNVENGEYIRREVIVAPAGTPIPAGRRHVFDGRLILAGWDLDRDVANPGDTVRLSTWWTTRSSLPDDLRLTVTLAGPGGKTYGGGSGFTRGIYPPPAWEPGELISEPRSIEIPGAAPEGIYRLSIAVEGAGIDGRYDVGEVDVDAARAREEADEDFRLHSNALGDGEFQAALSWIDRAIELRPGDADYQEARRKVLAGLRTGMAQRAAKLAGQGEIDDAADLLLATVAETGRSGELQRELADLSRRYFDLAGSYRTREHSFRFWAEAMKAYRRALRCDPSNSRALMAIEGLRGREYVQRTYGAAVLRADAAGAGGPPVAPLLERIQDEGFMDASEEIIHGSDGIRARLGADGTLRSLALLRQGAEAYSDASALASIDAKIDALDPKPVSLGGRLLFLASEIGPAAGGETRVSMWFRVTRAMRTDYRMFLHGYVKDRSILPEDRRQYEFANFDHDVTPPTSSWKPGTIVRHTWIGSIPPGDYRFLFGFFNSTAGRNLNVEGTKSPAVEIGWRTIPAH